MPLAGGRALFVNATDAELKEKLGYKFGEAAASFWMRLEDFLSVFSEVCVCHFACMAEHQDMETPEALVFPSRPLSPSLPCRLACPQTDILTATFAFAAEAASRAAVPESSLRSAAKALWTLEKEAPRRLAAAGGGGASEASLANALATAMSVSLTCPNVQREDGDSCLPAGSSLLRPLAPPASISPKFQRWILPSGGVIFVSLHEGRWHDLSLCGVPRVWTLGGVPALGSRTSRQAALSRAFQTPVASPSSRRASLHAANSRPTIGSGASLSEARPTRFQSCVADNRRSGVARPSAVSGLRAFSSQTQQRLSQRRSAAARRRASSRRSVSASSAPRLSAWRVESLRLHFEHLVKNAQTSAAAAARAASAAVSAAECTDNSSSQTAVGFRVEGGALSPGVVRGGALLGGRMLASAEAESSAVASLAAAVDAVASSSATEAIDEAVRVGAQLRVISSGGEGGAVRGGGVSSAWKGECALSRRSFMVRFVPLMEDFDAEWICAPMCLITLPVKTQEEETQQKAPSASPDEDNEGRRAALKEVNLVVSMEHSEANRISPMSLAVFRVKVGTPLQLAQHLCISLSLLSIKASCSSSQQEGVFACASEPPKNLELPRSAPARRLAVY